LKKGGPTRFVENRGAVDEVLVTIEKALTQERPRFFFREDQDMLTTAGSEAFPFLVSKNEWNRGKLGGIFLDITRLLLLHPVSFSKPDDSNPKGREVCL